MTVHNITKAFMAYMTIKLINYLRDSTPAVGFSLDKLRLITLTDRKLWLEYQAFKDDRRHAET